MSRKNGKIKEEEGLNDQKRNFMKNRLIMAEISFFSQCEDCGLLSEIMIINCLINFWVILVGEGVLLNSNLYFAIGTSRITSRVPTTFSLHPIMASVPLDALTAFCGLNAMSSMSIDFESTL